MKKIEVKTITGIAILTSVVIVLQMLGSFIKLGPFSISLVLIPIVLGAIIFGPYAGAFLGFVFSVVVLLTDSALFLAYNFIGTLITVIVKGTLAGFISGLVYKYLDINKIAKTFVSALVCPIVNTGIFVIGCCVFFLPLLNELAVSAGFDNVFRFLFFGMVGLNFIVEMIINVLLVPTVKMLADRWSAENV